MNGRLVKLCDVGRRQRAAGLAEDIEHEARLARIELEHPCLDDEAWKRAYPHLAKASELLRELVEVAS